jgi:hypothetical protein
MRRRHFIVVILVAAGLSLASSPRAAEAEGAFAAPDPAFADHCGAWRSFANSPAGISISTRPPSGPYTVASNHFVVHYRAPALEAYAQDVSYAAEHAYRVLVDTLLHIAPPPDGEAGGDARVDIYLRTPFELGNVYGTTVPDVPLRTPYFNTYTSWVEMVDTMAVARRRTVTAHEVYHVVQVGYDRLESLSVLELLSTWFEERAFDEYNIHYIWFLQFFRNPGRGLFDQSYTNLPWALFLTQRHGDSIMRDTLERCAQTPGPNPRGAFDGTLRSLYGTTLLDEFVEFGTWNYFTSRRDDGAHYEEGAAYPAMRCQRRSDCYPFGPFVTDRPMGELASNYFFFDGDGHDGSLWIRVEPESSATSFLTVTEFRGAVRERTTTSYAVGSPADSFRVDDWERCDSVLAVYQIDRGLPKDNLVVVSARYEPAPPPDLPWLLVLDRDGCRNPFDGEGDEFATRDGEESPVAAALTGAGESVVVSDSLLADLSGCDAVFVVGGFGEDGVTLSSWDLATLSEYMKAGGDVYMESARLGAWVDSALALGDTTLPAFWSMFGCEFEAGEDSANVASWQTAPDGPLGAHVFAYDAGEPDHRVGRLETAQATALALDDRGRVRAALRRVGASSRIVSTVLLGGSTGRFGSTREAFVADVLGVFRDGMATKPPPAALRLVGSRPNPVRDTAELLIDAPSAATARVTIYDVAGRRISTESRPLVRGSNAVRLTPPRASGVYFVVVEAGGHSARGRFMVLR